MDDKERMEELKAVRQEAGELDSVKGRQARPLVLVMAVMVIVWLVLLLFDLVNGKGVAATTAIVVAAFAALCWGNYREERIRAHGIYAIVAAVIAIALLAAHFAGVA